jgi:hypothetical protein
VVAKPWGDSEPYDFIVNPKKSFIFWRVQVKSAHTVGADGGCSFRAHDHNQKSYTSEDIDALVAYARPMNAWYVMPVRVVAQLKSLKRAGSCGRGLRGGGRLGRFCGGRCGGGGGSPSGSVVPRFARPAKLGRPGFIPAGVDSKSKSPLPQRTRQGWGTRRPLHTGRELSSGTREVVGGAGLVRYNCAPVLCLAPLVWLVFGRPDQVQRGTPPEG